MATVVITITDAPGGVTTVVEAKPDFPLIDAPAGPEPDVDKMTNAQAFAVGVLMEMSREFPHFDWRVFLRGD